MLNKDVGNASLIKTKLNGEQEMPNVDNSS